MARPDGASREGSLGAVARRPQLWPTALAELRAMALPAVVGQVAAVAFAVAGLPEVPARSDVRAAGAKVSATELVGYLEWCRWMRALAR